MTSFEYAEVLRFESNIEVLLSLQIMGQFGLLDLNYTSQTTAVKTHKDITVIFKSIATTCYFFVHTTKASVV